MHPYAEDLRNLFRIKFGGPDAEEAMARELIELNKIIIRLEQRIAILEKDYHKAFHRQRSVQAAVVPKMIPPIDDDEWIQTGRESGYEQR